MAVGAVRGSVSHASDGSLSRSISLATRPLHMTLRTASLRLKDAAYPRSVAP